MRKLYENFHFFHFQKRIVSAETIRGNSVVLKQISHVFIQNFLLVLAWEIMNIPKPIILRIDGRKSATLLHQAFLHFEKGGNSNAQLLLQQQSD
jgi:hypothetical protein